MIVLGSRGGVHEQIIPEIYLRVFEVLMRYRYRYRLDLASIPEVLPV